MNNLQRERIAIFRADGESYSRIADALGLSVNTVKSYCRRNNMGGNLAEAAQKAATSQVFCTQCGKELNQMPCKKALKFCCNECRVKWWNAHLDKVNKKAIYSFICANCGKPFTAYGNSSRKYCSHLCYVNDRFKDGETA